MAEYTDLSNLTFPPSFFEDEVRDGFYVPEMMKRYWAGHLTVLSEIDRICGKHDIPYFADYGTLLGAIRHKGFVPWDDDVDIIMLRHDLQRFLEIAPAELPEGMEVVDIQTQWDTDNTVVAVISDPSRPDHMAQFHGCPYRCNVDIMALDGCYDSDEEEAAHRNRFREVFETAAYYVPQDEPLKPGIYTTAQLYPQEAEQALRRAEAISGMKADRKKDLLVQVLRMLVRVAREVPDTEAETLDRFFTPRGTMRYQKKWYEGTALLPFEHTMIPVPAMYMDTIRFMYGDWERIIRGGAEHEYPSYGDQEAVLKAHLQGNPFRYTFSANDLHAERTPAPAARAEQAMALLEKTRVRAEALLAEGNNEAAVQLLDGAKKLTSMLEELSLPLSRTAREVVFIAVRPAWWDTMEPLYRAMCADENTEVRVICIPWYERKDDGTTGAVHDDSDQFPQDIALTPREAYDIEKRMPDVIVTQFPFDGTNRAVAIDPAYYASHLRNCTQELVYVPCFDPAVPEENDVVSRTSLRSLIEQPAVVFADRVVLPSDAMRQLYIDTMSEIAGEETRAVWEEKAETRAG